MSVLFLSHMFPNSADPFLGKFVYDLARILNHKVHVLVVAPVPYFPFMSKFKKYRNYKNIISEREESGLKIMHPRFLLIPRYWKWLDAVFYLFGCSIILFNQIKKCDVVVAHWTFPDAFVGLFFAKLLGKKIILVVHGNESIHYHDSPTLRKMLVNYTVHRMDHLVPVSVDLQQKLYSSYNIPADRMTVIHSGVDLELFPARNVYKSRHDLNLSAKAKVILCVARLSKEKAHINLLKAFKAICYTDNLSLNLYCLGEGPERERLEIYIKENDLERNVFLLGNVPHDRVHLWMSAADIFVLPSLWEGAPVVIGEAFACGLPVVASEVGGIPDLIVNDRLGLLFTPDSVSSLESALRLALEKNWDRNYIRRHGLNFSWEKIAHNFINIFDKICLGSGQ
ncbi:glycosyltransferase [uncultured Desulfobulbus sp.]|uniref:glycosyltransferase n=1 Tax=uncultured Desulfobulbus sp. TaxID=239745 RepID=UPI0029C9240D|nr:glycosyltransferase [uncultured Desulfobulbus sp.]